MPAIQIPSSLFMGTHALDQLQTIAQKHASILLFTDRSLEKAGLVKMVLERLCAHGAKVSVICDIQPEPTLEHAWSMIQQGMGTGATLVVGLGGGSVLDVAKLASLLLDGEITLTQLAEAPLICTRKVRSIMVPTTFGTGAEATPNAIVTRPEKQLKVGIVNPSMIPDCVILAPQLVRTLPQPVAAASAMDALAHAIECYTSAKATCLSDLYALEALRLLVPNMTAACNEQDEKAQEAMQLGAYYAGIAIAGSGTTAVHALSYPLGGKFHVPHGIANAILLGPVLRFNASSCEGRLAQVADALWPAQAELPPSEKARLLVECFESIAAQLRIPSDYAHYGVTMDDLDFLVEAGMQVTRLLNNNPRPVTAEDARRIYQEVLS